jgi:glyoxylase-like metal-dependent hydrolase (beta-lactamase superfamily II)
MTIKTFQLVGIGRKPRLGAVAEEKLLAGRPWSPTLGQVADGVWLLRGDIRGGMNIYFIEDGDGLIQFDAGTKPMTKAVGAVSEKLGPIKKVVLGHSHTDHRGAAPGIDSPVYCHPDEVTYAQRDEWPDYWDMSKLPVAWVRMIYPTLHRRWDGGRVEIAGTVEEGEEIAGFRVHHFPGHAPGQIGLFRESDRLALCSDTVYLIDSTRLKALPEGEASVPHPVWNIDHAAAKASVRKLAALQPAKVCAGHSLPLEGPGVADSLAAAAEKY